MKKTFTLFWLNGKSETAEGETIDKAFTNAGYGNGALRALDFYADGDVRDEWEFDKEKRTWKSKPKPQPEETK